MDLRDATADDAPAIVVIYNHYVLNTTISFEESVVTEADMRARIEAVRDSGLPWIVATEGGEIVGYAYATKWRVRHAYRFSVESSVYVANNVARKGIGCALYTALMAQLRDSGVHLVIGGIAQPNPASVALHERMGFVKVALFEEVGFKFGRWIDVGYWQLKLSAQPDTAALPPE
ncbi:arsinothricin resistance N-acetyltransferase ArsN1 family B [Massilia sp. PAMC28688]|uniref:arsinothricin resistance N-acetyltransferase ArsN1 family B n=1 Tax=Massilia sp. PAMC28688 TaxID=2861283 RepID=UPI001E5FEFE4|nr:arsinothricin resistance N-acetyltransferase ArsN1 family B [Massilia sp. PAMC28688]